MPAAAQRESEHWASAGVPHGTGICIIGTPCRYSTGRWLPRGVTEDRNAKCPAQSKKNLLNVEIIEVTWKPMIGSSMLEKLKKIRKGTGNDSRPAKAPQTVAVLGVVVP